MPRRLIVPVLTAALALTALASPARGDTRSQVGAARARLAALERRVESEQASVDAMHARLRSLALQVTTDRFAVAQIGTRVRSLRLERAIQEARYRGLRTAVGRIAAEVYITGTPQPVQAIVEPLTLADYADAAGYADAIAGRNLGLAAVAESVAESLRQKEATERSLLAVRADQMRTVADAQRALASAFAAEQDRLSSLVDARTEAAGILTHLRATLRAEELAAAQAALGLGTPLTFGRWADVFLRSLGAPVSRNTLVVMVAWQTAEYTHARWNPLATTYPMPGASAYNSSGVRDYVSLAQGIEATIATLRHPGYGYEAILGALARGADPHDTAAAINASRWCSGCTNGRYVVGLIDTVEQYYDRYAAARA